MTTNRRKKNSRQRGSHTHGWGSMKKHRGAGHHGGAGMAGTGKRADSKKPSIWSDKQYFGKHGFKHGVKKKTINIGTIEETLDALISRKFAVPEKDGYRIDIKHLGFQKILGSRKVTKKLFITCEAASKKAVALVKKVGGDVVTKSRKEGNSNGHKKHTSKSA